MAFTTGKTKILLPEITQQLIIRNFFGKLLQDFIMVLIYNILRWCSGEPNKGLKGSPVEACVTLKDCGLNDSSCTSNNYYICEFNK